MINKKKSKQVSMDSWLLKLVSRDVKTKTKNKDQSTNNNKKKRIIKNNINKTLMRNITLTMDH